MKAMVAIFVVGMITVAGIMGSINPQDHTQERVERQASKAFDKSIVEETDDGYYVYGYKEGVGYAIVDTDENGNITDWDSYIDWE